jgi:hypothetical protein
MSVQPSQPSGQSSGQSSGGESQSAGSEGRRFSTLIGSLAATSADRQETAARPTFTAQPSGPPVVTKLPSADPPDSASAGAATPAPPAVTGTESGTGLGTRPEPAVSPASPQAPEATRALRRHDAIVTDEPLLGDGTALRGRWQRVQADFVDDPQQAVGDAADLIEQTAQALVGALRQRQRTLRVMWERGLADDSASEDGALAARASETEHLRLMMQRYRALFIQLCRP